MGIPTPVPEPTEQDFALAGIGFDHWYEHDSECVIAEGKPEDWRQEVLTLIRLANHYRKQRDEFHTLLRAVWDKSAPLAPDQVHRVVSAVSLSE